ncbi:MAG: protein-L-isoaspartate(D-aspartate) O-methyltransferase [Chloroflexi bacterium]|nr:protein-L-isoaspartate(D-aspartate) O-methyltransferase [Chloroflexota bacterium]
MVAQQLRARGIRDQRVLDAFLAVPRERFVPPALVERAYEDGPLDIGEGQTISQPWVVAIMLQALELRPTDRLLEVGVGSGYALAVASHLCHEVFGVERRASLLAAARDHLASVGAPGGGMAGDVHLRLGDGSVGWPEAAPFDAILVSAAGVAIPPALEDQLAPAGRMVIPVGAGGDQQLFLVRRDAAGSLAREPLGPVRFVPLVTAPPTSD